MTSRRGTRWSAAGFALAWSSVPSPVAADEIRNWPCERPLAERLVAEEIWHGALPAPLPDDWHDHAAAVEVVALAADPANPPARGEAAIAALAERAGERHEEAQLAVFAGLLEQFDLQRSFVIEGVRDFVVRAKILQEAVERSEAAIAALPTEGGDEVEQERQDYLAARAFDARNLDDALEEAEFLCRRYGYLERKLERLTGAIRRALAN